MPQGATPQNGEQTTSPGSEKDAVLLLRVGVGQEGGSGDGNPASVHRLDEPWRAVRHHPGGLAVRFVVAEPGLFGSGFAGALAGGNFGDFSPKLIGPLSPAVADLTLDGLADGDPLGRGKVFPDLVLVVLPGQDAGHVHDPGQDGLALEDIPHGQNPALTEDEFEPVRHANGLEQTLLADAVGKGREVAHVPAVPVAHLDVSDLDFPEHGMACVHGIAPQLLDLDIPSPVENRMVL
jgi:hypothetical protein